MPLLRTLQQLDDFRVGQFCQPIWEFLNGRPVPSGRFVSVSELLGSASDTFYFSDLDIFVLDCICREGGFGPLLHRDTSRHIDQKFECAYQLFELTFALSSPQRTEKIPDDVELQRQHLHRRAHHNPIDPFECLCDSAETNHLYELEISWHRTSLTDLRSRVSTYRQLELDLRAVDTLISCLFFQHIERFPVLPDSSPSSRLQAAVREARRRFFGRLLTLSRLDLTALLGSDSQYPALEREFSDAGLLSTPRAAFVRSLVARLKALAPSAHKRDLVDAGKRYGRLRQTHDQFEAIIFLQTLSVMRVQLEDVDASAWRVRGPAAASPAGARAVPRQLLGECLARRLRFEERETGAQRLRGHEIVAVGHAAAALAELGGADAFAAVLRSFPLADRQAAIDLVKSAVATTEKGIAKVGVEFEPGFIRPLLAIGDWADAFVRAGVSK